MAMPQDAKVVTINNDGCPDCNSEGMDNMHEIYDVIYKEEGNYPHEEEKHIVIL